MSSGEGLSKTQLNKKHQKELKELRVKIEQIMKEAGKSKAERKAKLAETQAMEDELRAKHLEEMAALVTESTVGEDIDFEELASLTEKKSEAPSTSNQKDKTTDPQAQTQPKPPSKAQKRRAAKAEEEKKRRQQIEEAREQEENLGDRETEAIRQQLISLGLEPVDIPSDGNCMYNSIGHQLKARGRGDYSASLLRTMASEFMLANPDEFIPFMSDIDDDFDVYCQKVALQQSLWGGQMEALALSHSLTTPIWIVSAFEPILKVGESYMEHEAPIIMTFHRYLFALGEHYNSVQPIHRNQ